MKSIQNLWENIQEFSQPLYSGEVAEAAALGGQKNTLRFSAASDSSAGCTQDEIKQGRRCINTTSSLDGLWATFRRMETAGVDSPTFLGTFWSRGQII